jgi:hypothetical protein
MTYEKRKDGSNGITPSKLLSVVVTGRDDDYMPDYKYRITTSINHIARNLKQLGRLNDVIAMYPDLTTLLNMNAVGSERWKRGATVGPISQTYNARSVNFNALPLSSRYWKWSPESL